MGSVKTKTPILEKRDGVLFFGLSPDDLKEPKANRGDIFL